MKQHPKYRLAPFVPILESVIGFFGSLKGLEGKHFLELGPGNRVDLMRFLEIEVGTATVRGVGKSITWPWTRHKPYIESRVEKVYMLEALRGMPAEKYDLICSRRVMEQHSIDPWILLTSRRYWGRFLGQGFKNPGEDYPASRSNIEAIFTEAYRVLKPGGLIVSEIGRRRFSCLGVAFLEEFNPQKKEERSLGRISSLVTVVK